MQEYYSLASSLPTLRFDMAPPFSVEEFSAQCDTWLTGQDRLLLEETTLDPDAAGQSHPERAAARYAVWDTQLRNLLALRRQNDLKLAPVNWQRPCPSLSADVPENVNRALQAGNPFEVARELDRMRWRQLDEFSSLHPFDIDGLCVYKLKLAILERWQPRTAESGKAGFDACIEKIEKDHIDS